METKLVGFQEFYSIAKSMPCAIVKWYDLKVDKARRVILPKPIRDRLGLKAGSDLEIRETPEGIVLRPAERRPSLVKNGSFLVHTGELPPGYDVLKAIDDDRDERVRKAWGL